MANVLNAGFDIHRDDPKAVLAFTQLPERVLFHRGDRLYRFTSHPEAGFDGNAIFSSPWWHTQKTFAGLVRTANRTRSSIVQTARSQLAVTKQWNPTMEWMVIIELLTAAYGWVGPTRYQPADEGNYSVLLPGSANQVYIPNLARHSDVTSDAASIYWYGAVE
jgi:hypothetical protein